MEIRSIAKGGLRGRRNAQHRHLIATSLEEDSFKWQEGTQNPRAGSQSACWMMRLSYGVNVQDKYQSLTIASLDFFEDILHELVHFILDISPLF